GRGTLDQRPAAGADRRSAAGRQQRRGSGARHRHLHALAHRSVGSARLPQRGMSARLATSVFVSSLIRLAEREGGTGVVLTKGDATAGAVLILLAERGRQAI